MEPIYTTPKIVKFDDLSKPWYVFFRYNGELCRYKKGINRYKTYTDRLKEAKALCDALRIKLKSGWNPLVHELRIVESDITLYNSLRYALEKKKDNLAQKTYLGYRSSIGFIETAIIELKYDKLLACDTKRIHIKTILERVKKSRNASNKSYNKYLDHFRAVISELIQWDIIEFNPANNIKNMPVRETMAHIPATPKEHEIIKNHMQTHHINFYRFIASIFHTGIRPKELLDIQLRMVNMQTREIILPSGITKTPKIRVVPINPHFYEMLKEMKFDNLPKDYYLFGSFRMPGVSTKVSNNDIVPAPIKMKRDTLTKRWHKIVKEGLKLPHVTMYSNKKGGANAKILAGMDIDALQELYGHTSKLTTKIYITRIHEVHRKQIMEFSPEF